jgi:cation:H+ antiporter
MAAQGYFFLTQVKASAFWGRYMDLFLTPGWWQLVLCFLACSLLMIFRLNAIEKNGFEGTLVGTLIMPYFSGFPNLCFAYFMARDQAPGSIVLENCLVNNITNLTLVLAFPAMFGGLNLLRAKSGKEPKINHLSLLMSLMALIFFSAFLFFVSQDKIISSADGLLLVGIFFFWQLYPVFDLLKNNTRKSQTLQKRILIDFILIGLCAWGIFSSVENLMTWLSDQKAGFFSRQHMGVLSGIFMVIPNGFLAVYYASIKRADIAYTSQIGDCHICIPLCIGIFAIFSPIQVPFSFQWPLFILMGVSAAHFILTAFMGKLPRFAGVMMACLYGFFIYKEMIHP